MNYEIKRFDLLTVFKVSFLVFLAVGFLLGILYSMILVKMLSELGPLLDTPLLDDIGEVGFFAAVVMAMFMAVFLSILWSVITVIAAGIYNVIAGIVGGLKMEVEVIPGYQAPPVTSSLVPPPPPPGGSTNA